MAQLPSVALQIVHALRRVLENRVGRRQHCVLRRRPKSVLECLLMSTLVRAWAGDLCLERLLLLVVESGTRAVKRLVLCHGLRREEPSVLPRSLDDCLPQLHLRNCLNKQTSILDLVRASSNRHLITLIAWHWESFSLDNTGEHGILLHVVELPVQLLRLLIRQSPLSHKWVEHGLLFPLGYFHLSYLLAQRLLLPVKARGLGQEGRLSQFLRCGLLDAEGGVDVVTWPGRLLCIKGDTGKVVSHDEALEDAILLHLFGFGAVFSLRQREGIESRDMLHVVRVRRGVVHVGRVLEGAATYFSLN